MTKMDGLDMSPTEWEWACEQAQKELERLMRQHPDKVLQAQEKPALIGWFVGQTMRNLNGNGNPELVSRLANELIMRV